jgi:Zn finger protein HypA/HybF involved in hydrogenase expression
MTEIHALNRTLDQELLALLRGASLECLVCGEFVLHRHGDVECPECGFALRDRKAEKAGLQLDLQAG